MIDAFDSKEEGYFQLWLSELTDKGLIRESEYHPKPFLLSEKILMPYKFQMKTKITDKNAILAGEHSYQADWLIYWDDLMINKMFAGNDILTGSPKDFPFVAKWSDTRRSFFSVVDIKGNFNQNDAWRRFSIDQKWVYQRYGIFVQKHIIIPSVSKSGKVTPANALFVSTFLPERMLKTDISMKERKINFKYNLIDYYLRSIGL